STCALRKRMRWTVGKRIRQVITLVALIALAGGLFMAGGPGVAQGATQTLGFTTIGTSTDAGDANYLNGSRFTMPATAGTVTSMSVYVAAVNGAPNNKFQMAIYNDSAGSPGTLLASSAAGTLTPNAWNTAAITANLAANTPYWLIYNTNGTGTNNNMKFSNGGVSVYSAGPVTYGTWPANFGSSVVGSANFSIYATYNTIAGTATVTPTLTSTPTPIIATA